MRCSNCDRDIPFNAILCPYCGHKAETEDAVLVCQNCSQDVPGDALLCPYCGSKIETRPVTDEQWLQQQPSTQSILSYRFLQVQAVLFFVWCLTCSFCALASFFIGDQRFLAPLLGLEPGQATPVRPTRTREPTYTPTPTSDDLLTATSTPPVAAPSYWQIEENMKQMTEAQWNVYVDEIEGTRASNWVGWIEDISENASGGYKVKVDLDSPDIVLSTYNVVFDITDGQKSLIQKDQQIVFTGTIESVANILGGLQVRLADVEWEVESSEPMAVVENTPAPTAGLEPTSTVEPTSTFVPTGTPEPINTPEPTVTPEPTATLEPVNTPTREVAPSSPTGAFSSGGLGLSKAEWEQQHNADEDLDDMGFYDNGKYLVLFIEDKVSEIELMLDEPNLTIDEARIEAQSLIPEDNQYLEAYSPDDSSEKMIEVYSSESLIGQYEDDEVWFDSDPGTFSILYDVYDGFVPVVIISTGDSL
jgi:DNA-directed RNA polymerase subunit RPC12/RpoP